jgi:cytidyltransferase-like protein
VIVTTDGLAAVAGAVTMVDGAFDPLHDGHVEYFQADAQLCDPLLVNVTGDAYVASKHAVLLPAERRVRVIDALAAVDYVHLSAGTTADVLRALRPRRYVKGTDWSGRLPEEEVDICLSQGTEVVFLDTVRNSSTRLVNDAIARDHERHLAELEDLIAAQRSNAAATFDGDYFVEPWRDGSNAYTVEARRPIEGRNPELISAVLQPSSLLDAGCGPGVLMTLLEEHGVVADGLDASPDVRALAEPALRGRISIGTVVDMPYDDRSYDVVVCREVLEHLTVPEVARAVAELCRVSSRLVYVTTRFHPSPRSLFDVTTEFDVDPTHITCLDKNLLRALFVLNGLRRRADLEARMDWLDKRRVLVYERGA